MSIASFCFTSAMNSSSMSSGATLCTSTFAPARSASFASASCVACTMSGRPAFFASSPAVMSRARIASRSESGTWMYHTFTAFAPERFSAHTVARTMESLRM